MDVNLTIAIPIATVILAINVVTNFLRIKDSHNGSASRNAVIDDLKEDHKLFVLCFKELTESSIRSEVHFENMVRQLQDLNNKWRK